MVILSIDVIENSTAFINALNDRELDLRDNKIPVIENLGVTRDQNETIDFTNNDIQIVENFPLMPRLKTLLFSNNKIFRISNRIADQIPNLQALILDDNQIKDFDAIEPLKKLQNLKYLSLYGNEICLQKDYRLKVISSCPQVKYLDYQKVTQNERKQAELLSKATSQKRQRSKSPLKKGNKRGAGQVSAEEEDHSARIKRIRESIKNAKTLEEITTLERQLKDIKQII